MFRGGELVLNSHEKGKRIWRKNNVSALQCSYCAQHCCCHNNAISPAMFLDSEMCGIDSMNVLNGKRAGDLYQSKLFFDAMDIRWHVQESEDSHSVPCSFLCCVWLPGMDGLTVMHHRVSWLQPCHRHHERLVSCPERPQLAVW